MLILFSGVFVFLICIYLIYWLIWGRFAEYTDDAYVSGNIVQLMPQISGTVVAINADDTHLVLRGQQIIKLDSTDMQVAFQRAQATLAQTVRQVRQYFENVRQAQAALMLSRSELAKVQHDLKRRIGLVGKRAISHEEMEHTKIAVAMAQARYNLTLHRMRAARALVGNSFLYNHPLVSRAKENFKLAYLNLQRAVVIAPVTGYVAKRNVQVGQQISVNTPLLAIIPLNEVWIDANYKESQLKRIRIDQPVSLLVDAYSGVKYHGKVEGLSAGTGSAFALLPPQNATGNWIKIVQRLPVRIKIDAEELRKNPLRIGLSMRVTIDTSTASGSTLATFAEKKSVYMTNVYADRLAHVNKLIDTILHKNAPNMRLSSNTTLSVRRIKR
jgi:membrane fusion protein (multidrug efflux system)